MPTKPEQPPEGGQTERITVTLPRPLARRLRAERRSSGRSVSAILRDALRGYFQARGAPSLPSFTGVGTSGHRDTSERVEELIGARARRKRS